MAARYYGIQRGFTLIEIIAGIVIMAIAVTAMTSVLFPQANRSVDPVYQVRAAELGQSLMNEIMGKAFDENTDYNSGLRCNENGGCSTYSLGSNSWPDESESINEYDDIDDYHGYNQSQARLAAGANYDTLYQNFLFTVSVIYDDDMDGDFDGNDNLQLFKRVTVKVTTPGGQDFEFVEYKGNY